MASEPTSGDCDHLGSHRALEPLSVSATALERAATLFRTVGDPARLRLLAYLARGPACVTELALAEEEGLSTISQRLRLLREAHLVRRVRRGKHLSYLLADQHVIDLVRTVLAHVEEARVGQEDSHASS
jgi:ArsR family transcriptional regulator